MEIKDKAAFVKEAQAMKLALRKAQIEVEESIFESSVGNGAVTVRVTGKKALIYVDITQKAIDRQDLELLGEMVIMATNEALEEAEIALKRALVRVTSGRSIAHLAEYA